MTNLMLSAKFLGNDKIEIIETPIPIPAPGEVLLKTRFCGLCGSDKRLFHRGTQITPGHELTATVLENGPGANAPVGQRVAVYIHRHCGQCKFCRAGETNRCFAHPGGLVGWQTPGGYAQYLTVPQANLIPLPADISDGEGVLLLDTIGTAAYGIKQCMHSANSTVRAGRAAVVGCGPLGLGSFLVMSSLNWAEVAVYDPAQPRMQVALDWGAAAIEPQDEALESQFGVVVEASGHPDARALAMKLVEPGGAVLLLGENDNPWTITPSPKLRRKDCAYVRSYYFPMTAVEANIDLLRVRRREYQQLIAQVLPLPDLQQAFEDFCAGKTLKPLVQPNPT
jgi:threonine dehydrogenase-like Zn-dependent dehydrogenase